MWLRLGKPRRITKEGQAWRDLRPRQGENLSVYLVESKEEALRVAEIHGVDCKKDGPEDLGGMLIPAECLQGSHEPQRRADDNIHPFLNERHHEIAEAALDEDSARQLARAILRHPQYDSFCLTEDDLISAAERLEADPNVTLSEKWQEALRASRRERE